MEPRPLKFIVQACVGAHLSGSPDLVVSGVTTDSRQAQAGDLFVALRGERFDGHDFLEDVAAGGAAAIMVEQNKMPARLPNCAVIGVGDTRKALGQMAAAYRKEFRTPLVAVCGSNGKTTTKELVASVLRQKFKTLWSEASFNNDIGVPLTLLKLESGHQAARAGSRHQSSRRTGAADAHDPTQRQASSPTSAASIWNFSATWRAWPGRKAGSRNCYPRTECSLSTATTNGPWQIIRRTSAAVVRVGFLARQ